MMRIRSRRSDEPATFVVSGARASRHADIDQRQRKYLLTMAVRTLAFLAAVGMFLAGLQWEAAVVLALSLLAPLVGVVIANNHARSPGGEPEFYQPDADDQVRALGRGPTIDG
jgi:hypothetical protein